MVRTFQFRVRASRAGQFGQASLLALLGALASCRGKTDVAAHPGLAGSAVGAVSNALPGHALALSQAQIDAAALAPGELGTSADRTGGAWRIVEVPSAGSSPSIVPSPLGWLALSRRSLGPGKASTGYESALYRSTDGVHWTSLSLGEAARNVLFSGLAYGAGRYVMAGQRFGGSKVLWSSADAQHWAETPDPAAGPPSSSGISYAQGRFFHVGFNSLAESDNGRDWQVRQISLLQAGGAAYGNGVYLLVGSGPIQLSEDGWDWREVPLDCTRPSSKCVVDPSGGIHQPYHPGVLFAEGRFYTGGLSSEDGIHWQDEPERSPNAYVNGFFLGDARGGGELAAWKIGGETQYLRMVQPARAAQTASGRRNGAGVLDHDQPLPDSVNVEFEDGLTCETATCISLGWRLLLIPPPGTPPLPDRVPRTADGTPLLSADCPFSNQIFCTDYQTRSGCVCNPEAPTSPTLCQDVSQYRCSGRFTRRADEWQLDEVGDGGCSCDAVDANQPQSFGLDCREDASVCTSPLECLSIDPTASHGPPLLRSICTSRCTIDADCPSWEATGFCAGSVHLRCSNGSCQPRSCD